MDSSVTTTRHHRTTPETVAVRTSTARREVDRRFDDLTSSMPRLRAETEGLLNSIQQRMPRLDMEIRHGCRSLATESVTGPPSKASEHVVLGRPDIRRKFALTGGLHTPVTGKYAPVLSPDRTWLTIDSSIKQETRQGPPTIFASTGLCQIDAGAQLKETRGLPVDARGCFATLVNI